MVVIRLSRRGRKGVHYYFVTVVDSRKKLTGSFIERIGHYSSDSKEFMIELERFDYWVSVGAQPSLAVRRLARLMRKSQINTDKVITADGVL